MVEALPATSRHSKASPWLLPSGPDQVEEIPMREDQQSPHNNGLESTQPPSRLQWFCPGGQTKCAKNEQSAEDQKLAGDTQLQQGEGAA